MKILDITVEGLRIRSPNHTSYWNEWKIYKHEYEWVINYFLNSALEELQRDFPDVNVPTHSRDLENYSEPIYDVFLTRKAHKRLDDHDNLRMGFKKVADIVTQWLYPFSQKGAKDNLINWHYVQEKANPGVYSAKIKITWE
jgi:hypothetical protein